MDIGPGEALPSRIQAPLDSPVPLHHTWCMIYSSVNRPLSVSASFPKLPSLSPCTPDPIPILVLTAQVASGMPEAEVAAKLRRSRNAIVRRVRLLIARATGAGNGCCPGGGGGGLSALKPTTWSLQGSAGGFVVADGSRSVRSQPIGSRASSLQRVSMVTASDTVPVGGSTKPAVLSAESVPPSALPAAAAPSASGAVTASVQPPVDPGEAAAVRAILSARAAAAVARSTTSLPHHLLDPLIQCIRTGNIGDANGQGASGSKGDAGPQGSAQEMDMGGGDLAN